MTTLVRTLAALHLLAALVVAGLGAFVALYSAQDLDTDPWAELGLFLGGVIAAVGAVAAAVAACAVFLRGPVARHVFAVVTAAIGLLACFPVAASDPVSSPVVWLVLAPSLGLLVAAVLALREAPALEARAG